MPLLTFSFDKVAVAMAKSTGLVDYDTSSEEEEEEGEEEKEEEWEEEERREEEGREGEREEGEDEEGEEEEGDEGNGEEGEEEEEERSELDDPEVDNAGNDYDHQSTDSLEEPELDNAGDRRQRMWQAIRAGTNKNPKFIPDVDDLDWENKIFRQHVLLKSAKVTSDPAKVHSSVLASIAKGTKLDKKYERQVSNTGKLYTHGLRQIARHYQDLRPNFQLHYSHFLAFGTNNFVRLADPTGFVEQWEGASVETKKNFMASHSSLMEIVRDRANWAEGALNFAQPYRQEHSTEEAERKGANEATKYIDYLDRLRNTIARKKPWEKMKRQLNSKRIDKQETEDVLWGSYRGGANSPESLSQASLKYLRSKTVQDAESNIINHSKTVPLTNDQWVQSTRYLVTRIQVEHGTRMEAQDMTVKEWENRKAVKGPPFGLVTIDRKFTKLEGKIGQPTMLVLNVVDTALCLSYEMAKVVKFPELVDQPDYRASSFFINSAGNTYADHHGNPLHLTDWCRITDREDIPSTFRHIMSGFSLTTADTNKANFAFVNNHSEATMTRIYAQKGDKVLAGISALVKYREDHLKQTDASNLPATQIKIPKEIKERQTENLRRDWDQILSRKVETETIQDKLDSCRNGGPANDDSRASLVELCVAEKKTGTSINNFFLADILLRKPRLIHMKTQQMVEAVLHVIDSFEFAHQEQSKTLQKLLVEEAREYGPQASNEISDDLILFIEREVIGKHWIQGQLNKLGNPGIKLSKFRLPAAFMDIAATTGESYYCLGSNLISNRVSDMIKCREYHATGKEQEEEQADAMDPRSIIELSRRNLTAADPSSPIPTNSPTLFKSRQVLEEPKGEKSKSPKPTTSDSSSDEDVPQREEREKNPRRIKDSSSDEENNPNAGPSSPSQRGQKRNLDYLFDEQDLNMQMVLLEQATKIKVSTVTGPSGRLMHWTKAERVNLLTGVLAWMEDPRLDRRKQGKEDLMRNVSPRVTDNRSYEDVEEQYYRWGSPKGRMEEGGMYGWLKNYIQASPEIQWSVESLRKNQQIICEAYKDKDEYTRKC